MSNYQGYNNQSGYGQGDRYGQGNQYGQNTGYGQGNPYAQIDRYGQSNPYAQNDRYGQQENRFGSQNTGRYGQQPQVPSAQPYGQDVEMGNMNQPGQGLQPPANDKFAILRRCQEVEDSIKIVQEDVSRLRYLQQASLDDPDSSSNSRTTQQLNAKVSDVNAAFKGLAERVKAIKGTPGAANPQNAGRVRLVEKNLKEAMEAYQQGDMRFRKELDAQIRRQIRIVSPNATEEEIRQQAEDPQMQVFTQALQNSGRRGEQQAKARAVQDRHKQIQDIVRSFEEISNLMNTMATMVLADEDRVLASENHTEDVVTRVEDANQNLDKANVSARAKRRKQWWCLLIVVIILAIVGIVVGVVISRRPQV